MGDDRASSVRIVVKAVPGARRDEIVGMLGERLKVRVRAPAEGGRANEAICALIASAVGIPPRGVRIVSGHASSEKIVEIASNDADVLARALALTQSARETRE